MDIEKREKNDAAPLLHFAHFHPKLIRERKEGEKVSQKKQERTSNSFV